MPQTTFDALNLAPAIMRAVTAQSYTTPTPIQAQAIPHLMAGRDLIGCAQTGTGKTAAFALPILHQLVATRLRPQPRSARVLVLTPTRELAAQVSESFRTYGRYLGLSQALVFGGVAQGPQVKSMARGTDVLVATPGRLLDLMEQGYIRLSTVEYFVLDEADRMLDMGFLPAIRQIIATLPAKRQSLLFSATMPREIMQLAESILQNPVKVAVAPPASTAARIEERVIFVEQTKKSSLLATLLQDPEVRRVLVFTRTKRGANRLEKQLGNGGGAIGIRAIHGNKSQNARNAALLDFRTGRCRVLVATDVASRGIDVDGVSHVINYDLPNEPESYIHRIGRTARAGASGTAISFCGAEERPFLRSIERLLGRTVPVCQEHSRALPPASAGKSAQARPAHKSPPPRRTSWRSSRSPRTFARSR